MGVILSEAKDLHLFCSVPYPGRKDDHGPVSLAVPQQGDYTVERIT